MDWSERILSFPVRAAAVDDFLRALKARGAGDLNAVLTTLNESGLCRQALAHWTGHGWISVAPNTPLLALAGPGFDRGLTLRGFCGETGEAGEIDEKTDTGAMDDAGQGGAPPAGARGREEESRDHGDS